MADETDYSDMAQAAAEAAAGKARSRVGGTGFLAPYDTQGKRGFFPSRMPSVDVPEEGAPVGPMDAALMMLRTRYGIPAIAAAALLESINPARAGPKEEAIKRLWHGISNVKLARPIEEMRAGAAYRPSGLPTAEKTIFPADLQGGVLVPTLGDRSMAGQTLLGVAGTPLERPVALQGGHGYMSAESPRGVFWASAQPVVTRLENRAGEIAATGRPAYFPHTAMSPTAVDYSHHVFDPLAQLLKDAPIRKGAAGEFNAEMRAANETFKNPMPDFPGVKSPRLGEYLANAAGDVRNKFAQTVEKAQYQKQGFPSVADVRVAVTDPRLMDVPWGATGASIGQATPGLTAAAAQHGTYPVAMSGTFKGNFPEPLPPEIAWADAWAKLQKQFEGQPSSRLQRAFSMQLPMQQANQKWVDRASDYFRRLGYLAAPAAAVPFGEMLDGTRQ